MIKKLTLLFAITMLIVFAGCKNNDELPIVSPCSSSDEHAQQTEQPEPTQPAYTLEVLTPSDIVDTNYINYPKAPAVYKELLNEYRTYVDCRLTLEDKYGYEFHEYFEDDSPWYIGDYFKPFIKYCDDRWFLDHDLYDVSLVTGGFSQENSRESFGYAAKDINGDGIKELFILYGDKNEAYIDSILSFSEGKPVLFAFFGNRCRCTNIDKNGRIYESSSGGAGSNSRTVYNIARGGGSLKYETIFDDEGLTRGFMTYYTDKNPEGTKVSYEEGKAVWARLSVDNEPCNFNFNDIGEFIPLFDYD